MALDRNCSALDMLSLTFWSHATYTYLVTDYGNLAAANTVVWYVIQRVRA